MVRKGSLMRDFWKDCEHKALWHLPTSNSFVSKKWTDSLADDLPPILRWFLQRCPNQQLTQMEEWKNRFERHADRDLHDDDSLIGYSLGAMRFS